MKQSILSLLLIIIATAAGYAQTVKNVQARAEGNKVYIDYDLVGTSEGQKYTIELRSSIDNYTKPLVEVSGDAGEDIEAGLGKTIIWNAISEQGNFSGSVTFEVIGVLTFSPLEITNPTAKNGAKIGKDLDVQWSGGDRGRNLKMAILQGPNTIVEIPNVGSSGNYQWNVPKSVAKGDNYQIKLFDPTKPNDAAMSAEFSMKKTSILVYVIPGAVVAGAAAFLLLKDNGTEPPVNGGCTDVCNSSCSNYNPLDPSCVTTETLLAEPPPLPGGGN